MKLLAAFATEITDEGEFGIHIRQHNDDMEAPDLVRLTDEQARAIAKEIMRILETRKAVE